MQNIQQVDYIRIEPASALAGVSRQWLLRLVKGGGVPGAANVAGYHVFDRAAFEPWAEAIGNLFSSSTAVYGPAVITGQPAARVKSLAVHGTSIEIGWNSTDANGDFERNFGMYERGLLNRCGVLNLASPSQTYAGYSNPATFAKTRALLVEVGPAVTHSLLGAPSNDVQAGSSKAAVEAQVNSVRAFLAGLGHKVDFTLLIPRTSSIDSFATVANQTEAAGFGAGGVAEGYNADVTSGVLVIASRLKDSMTPAEVQAAIDDAARSGVPLDLAEATQNRDLLGLRKNIAGGVGRAADDMATAVTARNETAVPKAISALAKPLEQKGETGRQMLGTVLAKRGNEPIDVSAIMQDTLDRAAKADPDGVAGKAYQKVLDRLGYAEKNGNTFAALHAAKQELDDIYIEGADAATQMKANRLTSDVRKAINDKLRAADPLYGEANRRVQAGMVGRDLQDALSSTNDGSVAALYNKLWAKPESREELARLLDAPDYDRLRLAMAQVKKIAKGGMGGSDTESRLMTRQAMNAATGAPLIEQAADVSRGSLLGSAARGLSDRVRQKDLQALQRQLVNPDASAIAERMRASGNPFQNPATGTIPYAITPTAAKEATKAAIPMEEAPLAPTSEAAPPDRLQRFAQAESGNNPNARSKTSSASGLLQFTDDTWARAVSKWGKELGVALNQKSDPEAQMALGAKLDEDNGRILGRAIGREPTDAERYAAWVFGPSAAAKLVAAQGSGRDAATLYPRKVTAANRGLFFAKGKPKTVEQLMAQLEDKVS